MNLISFLQTFFLWTVGTIRSNLLVSGHHQSPWSLFIIYDMYIYIIYIIYIYIHILVHIHWSTHIYSPIYIYVFFYFYIYLCNSTCLIIDLLTYMLIYLGWSFLIWTQTSTNNTNKKVCEGMQALIFVCVPYAIHEALWDHVSPRHNLSRL